MGSLAAPIKVTEAWFKNTLLPYLNGTLEDQLASVSATATSASTTAGQAYKKPAPGIGPSDFTAELQASLVGAVYLYPYPRKVDARASLGLQSAARPDAPIVIWGLDVGQALPAAFQTGAAPKFPGDDAVYVAAV